MTKKYTHVLLPGGGYDGLKRWQTAVRAAYASNARGVVWRRASRHWAPANWSPIATSPSPSAAAGARRRPQCLHPVCSAYSRRLSRHVPVPRSRTIVDEESTCAFEDSSYYKNSSIKSEAMELWIVVFTFPRWRAAWSRVRWNYSADSGRRWRECYRGGRTRRHCHWYRASWLAPPPSPPARTCR